MGVTGYPDNPDTFSVPTLPEDTPLSQAGPGNDRNHVELLDDLGDAVEAIERGAAYKTHDHSGDNTDIKKGPKLKQANTHEDADTDLPGGIHHHVGETATTVAVGNHVHDYNDSTRLLNRPWVICTTNTRPPMPFTGQQIYEKDTKTVRVWDVFGNTEAVSGLNTLDNYETFTLTDWAVSYTLPSPANGAMGTPNGQHLSWTDGGNATNRAIARRIKAADKVTLTDDQVMTWKNGPVNIEGVYWFTAPASNDKYFRMSADGQSYWRVIFGYDWVFVNYTTTGPNNEKELARAQIMANQANTSYRAELKDRTLSLYYMGEPLFTVVDRDQVTDKGPNFRGWGVGQGAGNRFLGQTTPSSEDWVRVQDSIYYVATNRWTILPVANIPVVRLRQSQAQQISPNGTIVEWAEELEDPFDFFNVNANKTDIVMKEPGLYHIEAAIQWHPSTVPDTAMVVVCLNGIETTIRNQQFMRGQAFQPGFSQTIPVSGKLRVATNDVVTIKVKYVGPGGLLGLIFSFFDGPSRVNSRIDLTYKSP